MTLAALRHAFASGSTSPRHYLEECLERIERREPVVQAWVTLGADAARQAADAATLRWRAGLPLSRFDGIPVGVKDLIHTADLPTQMNSPLYAGWHSGRDAASVWWLRQGGSIVLGKTVTTEFGVGASGPTTNPHDATRTPGGSSSGSAAAVAAGMVPWALSTQAMGSIIRPAGYCGVYGFKPSFGALNRAGIHSLIPSQGYLGTHAATLADAWEGAAEIAATAGGDAGYAGLGGGPDLPAPQKPRRLLRLRTSAWNETDAESQAAFDDCLARLREAAIDVVDAEADEAARAFEADLADWIEVYMDIVCWEMRWPMAMYAADGAEKIAERATGFYRHGLAMTRDRYAAALARRRLYAERHAAFAARFDAVITPATPGPAPVGLKFTGSPGFNSLSSGLGAPAFSLPLLSVRGLPLGVQLIGYRDRDADLAGVAAWFDTALAARHRFG
jgi:Asp-tRNA(Asn)/Glu-tRNA(Gln) amidotransferase A subunit family amidase